MRPPISFALVAALAAAAGLAACQQNGSKPVAGICKPFAAPAAGGDGPAMVEDCLHRWSYALAGGPDSADVVADAAVAACTAPLARWNQQGLVADAAGQAPPAGRSLLTGEATTPIAEHANFAAGRALFYVVQARAGACKPPPRKDGAPAMTDPAR